MTDERKKLTEDILGEFGFRVVWSVLPHWADVEVYEITSRQESAPLFHRKDAPTTPDNVPGIEQADKYLTGYLKWDGCNELDQGCHHFCEEEQLIKHCLLLRYLWQRAHELMDSSDHKPPAPSRIIHA